MVECVVPDRSSSGPLLGMRAVICEDEVITILQVRRALQQAGVDVVGVARTGREAVATVLESRPDFVLMDIRMPDTDGLMATQLIMDSFDTCIVMMTAFRDLETVERAIELGVSGYIIKPADSGRIVTSIASAMNLHRRGERTRLKAA